MATPVVTVPPDAVLDTSYGVPAVEPRGQKAPPISRNYQLADDFTPEVPAALQGEPQAPVTPPPVPQTPPVAPETPPAAPVTPPTPEPQAVAPPAPVPDNQPPVKLRQVIDLGDGTGTQVFEAEAPTLAEAQTQLIAKLTKAQENATRKIRELAQKAKAKPDRDIGIKPIQFTERQVTDQEMTELVDLWKTNPVEAWKKTHEICTGAKPEVVVGTINASNVRQLKDIADTAAVEFIADHADDYDPTAANGTKIFNFLRGCTRTVTEGGYSCKFCAKVHDPELIVTRNNLEYAFEQLVEQGTDFKPTQVATPTPTPSPVVVPAPAPPVQAVPTPQPAPPAATPAPAAPPVETREIPPPPVMLSDRSGQRPPEPTNAAEGVNVSEFAALNPKEMKARIGQLIRNNRGSGR